MKERGREVLFQSFALRFDNGREKKKRKKYQDRLFSSIVNPARFNQPPVRNFIGAFSPLFRFSSKYSSGSGFGL